jgi:hypothetical protein
MGDVVNLDEFKPNKVSEVVCLKCLDRWIAIRPIEVKLKRLECEKCGSGFVIETGEDFDDQYLDELLKLPF